MRTNIDIDDKLLRKVMKLGGYKTKREAVHRGLEAAVELARREAAVRQVLDLAGRSDLLDPAYDHKANRALAGRKRQRRSAAEAAE